MSHRPHGPLGVLLLGVLLVVLGVVVLLSVLLGVPGGHVGQRATRLGHIPSVDASAFMRRYGYMEQGPPVSAALRTEDANAYVEALKLVQKFGGIAQTGVLDEATEKLMASPRCGCPDVARNKNIFAGKRTGRVKRFVRMQSSWKKRHFKYHITDPTRKFGSETLEEVMVRAFNEWGQHGRLNFSMVRHKEDADIAVAFARGAHGDDNPFNDTHGNILAHAIVSYDKNNNSNSAVIHFDDDDLWAVNATDEEQQKGAMDLFLVAVHEVGHVLGLSHSSDISSIMYPSYQSHDSSFTLGDDEIDAMYKLYRWRRFDGDKETPDIDLKDERTPRTVRTTTTTPRPRPHPVVALPSVEEHKKYGIRRPSGTSGSPGVADKKPNLCAGNYDAVAQLRGELFVFKGEFVWRLRRRGEVLPGYPVPLRRMFRDLPECVSRLDAVYQRDDGNIVVFAGPRFWVYNASISMSLVGSGPQPVTRYGLPAERVDAVMVRPGDGASYFFRKSEFWRYNSSTSRLDADYPRHIKSSWKGLPDDIDDAMTWTDGITYFFKGLFYYEIDNKGISVQERKLAPQYWFGCPKIDFPAAFTDKNENKTDEKRC